MTQAAGRREHPRLRGDQGAATTEIVIITPALLFIILLLVQFGLWLHATHVAKAAAQEGARAARIEGGTEAGGQAAADDLLNRAANTLITNRVVTSQITGTTARVQVQGDVVAVVPFANLTIDAVSEGPLERFTSGGP